MFLLFYQCRYMILSSVPMIRQHQFYSHFDSLITAFIILTSFKVLKPDIHIKCFFIALIWLHIQVWFWVCISDLVAYSSVALSLYVWNWGEFVMGFTFCQKHWPSYRYEHFSKKNKQDYKLYKSKYKLYWKLCETSFVIIKKVTLLSQSYAMPSSSPPRYK
jgi:hypothetical protein